MRVVLQYFDGCPSWRVADERLKAAIVEVGAESSISYEQITTPEAADRAGFVGSPTILIDGSDPFRVADAVPGLACRRYPADGGFEGSPSVAQLIDALRNA